MVGPAGRQDLPNFKEVVITRCVGEGARAPTHDFPDFSGKARYMARAGRGKTD